MDHIVRCIADQGVDTIRPDDNGGLCGGGAFETKGCAENDCKNSNVNNAGSDGIGSSHVVIDNVRLNDYYAETDRSKVGVAVLGNYNCALPQGPKDPDCCFCKPNGIRATQVGVWCAAQLSQFLARIPVFLRARPHVLSFSS